LGDSREEEGSDEETGRSHRIAGCEEGERSGGSLFPLYER
jgi:hypothetical protein